MRAYGAQQLKKGFEALKMPFLKKRFLDYALDQGKGMALWRLPHQNTQHLVMDLNSSIQPQRLNIEESPAGFALGPFINPGLEKTQFIQADIHISFAGGDSATLEGEEVHLIKGNGVHLENILSSTHHQPHFNEYLRPFAASSNSNGEKYISLVKKGIQEMKNGSFQKVVLSRFQDIKYPNDFELIPYFQKLCQTYPSAFCYLAYLPGEGLWLGASPEILISIDAHQIFRTVALAGTQAFKAGLPLSDVSWTQKEIEEQALVSRYIINCFKKIRLREFEEMGPKTAVAGNLMHLKTFFEVDMRATHFPELGSVMLELLHPTSAVCGMPKDTAFDFIIQQENYDREFYSGFLGPVNIDKESHLFVNLRCLQLFREGLRLYAGAGITTDSKPQKEWQETNMKCQTLLKVLDA